MQGAHDFPLSASSLRGGLKSLCELYGNIAIRRLMSLDSSSSESTGPPCLIPNILNHLFFMYAAQCLHCLSERINLIPITIRWLGVQHCFLFSSITMFIDRYKYIKSGGEEAAIEEMMIICPSTSLRIKGMESLRGECCRQADRIKID